MTDIFGLAVKLKWGREYGVEGEVVGKPLGDNSL
jgi:hypothetical protein